MLGLDATLALRSSYRWRHSPQGYIAVPPFTVHCLAVRDIISHPEGVRSLYQYTDRFSLDPCFDHPVPRERAVPDMIVLRCGSSRRPVDVAMLGSFCVYT